jgi:hypothetical protein
VVLTFALASVALGGCGSEGGSSRAEPAAGGGSELFPDESIQDWVSYSDHVAVYTVVDERAMPLDAEERQSGEGYAGRVVTLRIDKTLWSAPSAPSLPREIEMEVFGSVFHAGEERPVNPSHGPRVNVEERYLGPLVQVNFEVGPEWWPLTPASQMPLVGSRVESPSWESTVSQILAGKTIDDVAHRIYSQEADPLAVKYRDLRPQDRVQAVLREKEPVSR